MKVDSITVSCLAASGPGQLDIIDKTIISASNYTGKF